MLPLVDSGSSRCRERAASTLDTIASVGIRFGVTECFSPYDSPGKSWKTGLLTWNRLPSTGVNHYRHHTNDSSTTLTLQTNRTERPNFTKCIRLTTSLHLTLMMTSAQVVETSVTTTDNSPSQDYSHPNDQTTLLHVTPGFKPFTVYQSNYSPQAEWILLNNPLDVVSEISYHNIL